MNEIKNIKIKQASRGKRAFLQMIDDIWDEYYKDYFDKLEDWDNYVDVREVVNMEEVNGEYYSSK